MTAIKDLFGSERGLLGLLLIVCCTVLAAMNRMTFSDWQSYTMWIFGIYVGGKTITGAVQIAKGKAPDELPQMRESKESSAKHAEYMRELDANIAAAKADNLPPIAPPAA